MGSPKLKAAVQLAFARLMDRSCRAGPSAGDETMNRTPRAAALAALIAATLSSAAFAQSAPVPDTRFGATTLDLTASGEVTATPDMATITLGVTQQGATAAVAMQANARLMAAVVAALRAGGIEARDIQTSSLNLAPQYVYAQNQPAKLTGYEASNQVTVTVRDLARLGPTVDAIVGAGATNIGGIEFGLMSRVPAENAARLAAVKALDDKAALYADASGYKIGRLVNLSEGVAQTAPRPMVMMAARMDKPVPTPVEAGDLTVRVDVTGEFELIH
jgi:uncharacterized protein